MSLQSQIILELKKKPSIKLNELKLIYPDEKASSLKTAFYRGKKSFERKKLYETLETNSEVINFKLSNNITLDKIEKLIIAGKTPIPVLRVMLDLLKVKQQDQSELKEIDLEKFYKIGIDD